MQKWYTFLAELVQGKSSSTSIQLVILLSGYISTTRAMLLVSHVQPQLHRSTGELIIQKVKIPILQHFPGMTNGNFNPIMTKLHQSTCGRRPYSDGMCLCTKCLQFALYNPVPSPLLLTQLYQ